MPDCTMVISTPDFASDSRLRLSNEPSDSMILSLIPFRASIFWYRSAIASKLLPLGPLLMVSVWGGAGRI